MKSDSCEGLYGVIESGSPILIKAIFERIKAQWILYESGRALCGMACLHELLSFGIIIGHESK